MIIGDPTKTKTSRRTANSNAAPVNDIIIIDSACDQSIVNGHAFVVVSRTGEYFHVNGVLTGWMEADTPLEVVDAVTKVTLKSGTQYLLQMNQSLIDMCPEQRESLLQPHQSRAHGVLIDDCPTHRKTVGGTNGSQCIQTGYYNPS